MHWTKKRADLPLRAEEGNNLNNAKRQINLQVPNFLLHIVIMLLIHNNMYIFTYNLLLANNIKCIIVNLLIMFGTISRESTCHSSETSE